MIRKSSICGALALCVLTVLPAAATVTWFGRLTAEGRMFPHAPQHENQYHHAGGGALELGVHYTPASAFEAVLESRVAYETSLDPMHQIDLRELYVRYAEKTWQLRLGLHRVAWGASDFVSVIDVINQRDGLAWPGLSHKLGQPMVQWTIWPARGRLDLYYLPFFREFPFPGYRGRLRPSRPVATEHAIFEAGTDVYAHDYAMRYRLSMRRFDVAVHVFEGRNRMPYLVPDEQLPDAIRPEGIDLGTVYVPFYEDMLQIGGEMLWAAGAWLWKIEAAWREGFADSYAVGIGGFERSFSGLLGGSGEISLIVEYGFDTRGKSETSNALVDHDLFVGGRWAPGDMAGTTMKGGLLLDMETDETVAVFEAERRIGQHTSIGIDALWFTGITSSSHLYAIRQDDFIRLEWIRYF